MTSQNFREIWMVHGTCQAVPGTARHVPCTVGFGIIWAESTGPPRS
ncbi:MAG: hypothetical protein RIR10_1580 [Planctomycetota bacterium]|jgi:hypothetical protein